MRNEIYQETGVEEQSVQTTEKKAFTNTLKRLIAKLQVLGGRRGRGLEDMAVTEATLETISPEISISDVMSTMTVKQAIELNEQAGVPPEEETDELTWYTEEPEVNIKQLFQMSSSSDIPDYNQPDESKTGLLNYLKDDDLDDTAASVSRQTILTEKVTTSKKLTDEAPIPYEVVQSDSNTNILVKPGEKRVLDSNLRYYEINSQLENHPNIWTHEKLMDHIGMSKLIEINDTLASWNLDNKETRKIFEASCNKFVVRPGELELPQTGQNVPILHVLPLFRALMTDFQIMVNEDEVSPDAAKSASPQIKIYDFPTLIKSDSRDKPRLDGNQDIYFKSGGGKTTRLRFKQNPNIDTQYEISADYRGKNGTKHNLNITSEAVVFFQDCSFGRNRNNIRIIGNEVPTTG